VFTVAQDAVPVTDDHGDTPATATVWPVATVPRVAGVLETGPDSDMFRVTAPVSGSYSFRSATADGDVYGVLMDAGGTVIVSDDDGGGDRDFLITAQLTAGQVYYLQVRNYSTSYALPLQYTVTVTVPAPGSVSLAPPTALAPAAGGTVSTVVTSNPAQWSARSDSAWLTLAASSGQSGGALRVTAAANTDVARTGRVTVTAGSASAEFTVTQASGAPADDHGNTPGTATVWPIATEPRVAGVLETGPDFDVFRFTAPASGTYSFRSATTMADVYGTLMDANGAVIVSNDDAGGGSRDFLVTAELTTARVYYLEVRNYSPLHSTPVPYTVTATVPLVVPGSVLLAPSVAAVSEAGGAVTTVVTSNPVVWSAGSDVSWLTLAPASSLSGSMLRVTAAANTGAARTGRVTVTAGSAYAVFTVDQSEAGDDHGNTPGTATAWPVATQSKVAGVLETGSDSDVFRFTAPASGTYSFRSATAAGDPCGDLMDSAGAVIATDDDGGEGRDFLIAAELTAGRVYYLRVRNYSTNYAPPLLYTVTAAVPGAVASRWD
jgi:hypothetical protein